MNFEHGFIARPWIKGTHPPFRYLTDASYLKDFWDEGKLRLPAFSAFRRHDDEHRKDENQGRGQQHHMTHPGGDPEKRMYLEHDAYVGPTCYVLSTSLRHDPAFTKYGTYCFGISDIANYCDQVARQLTGYRCGYEGLCDYGGRTFALESLTDADSDAMLKELAQGRPPPITSPARTEWLFTKDAKHADELEYRLIFETDHRVEQYIDIVAPGARQYCFRHPPG